MTLAELQQIAAENSPTIRQALHEIEAARGNAIQVGLPPNPFFGYEGDSANQMATAGIQGAYFGQTIVGWGKLRLAHMVEGPLVGRHVLLIEDIIDSGRTVSAIERRLRKLRPASLRLAALLDRPARREVETKIDFTGFVIPDRFVIGYGLDYAGLYRELPGIYTLT